VGEWLRVSVGCVLCGSNPVADVAGEPPGDLWLMCVLLLAQRCMVVRRALLTQCWARY
jgi:hypothetical protein